MLIIMSRPSRRKSRTFRRVPVKVSKGTSMHYRRRKPKQAHCSKCGSTLPAVPRLLSVKMAALAKTKKRPERPYGGILCTRCMRATIKQKTRMQ